MLSQSATNQPLDVIQIYVNGHSPPLPAAWIAVVVLFLILILFTVLRWYRRRFSIVSLDVSLGGIGRVELRPRVEDIEVAHKIWTELVTRKAAIPIDPEHDVIVEIYDSWYELFGHVRELISQIPARLIREDPATRQLIRIATESLNKGLRPHMTEWQARFRNWYAGQEEALKAKTPQEVQREFPGYKELMSDLRRVNEELVQYADQLHKFVRGR